MATAWKVAMATAVVGWLVSPVITFFLPKIISCFVVDPSEKLRQLKIHIMPELQKTLRAVDQARMLRGVDRAREEASDVSTLNDMAAWLRHAREDAEDIFDDALEIEFYRNEMCWQGLYGAMKACLGIVLSVSARLLQWAQRNSCLRRLYGAVKAFIVATYGAVEACVARCLRIARIVWSGSARLVQWARNWFKEPVHVNASAAASHDHVQMNDSAAASHDHVVVTIHTGASDKKTVLEAAPSDSAADKEAVSQATLSESASHQEIVLEATLSDSALDEEMVSEATLSDSASSDEQAVSEDTSSCSSFDVFKNCCRSIINWLDHAFEAACFYRNWSYVVVGITNNRENATALNFLVTAISRRSLEKRIEKVESTISEVKKSPLLDATSKSTLDDIANKNRSRIRTASNRKVFGREVLRDSIMAKLREHPHGTSPCYSAIGIYGVAGSGKTTFARYIRDFIEEECKEELFDTIMCIHVSETFSVADIFHEMLKDITKDRQSNISDREELEEELKDSLHGKRFFLILDDLWVKTKNDPQLETLISPLNVGLKGSKILVTARTKVAAGVLCADEPMKLPDLDEDQYLSMFLHYALGGTRVADDEFKRVGRVIAKKLHGSPIAAVVVAGRLGANRAINFWKNTADRDMLNDTMDALWWSYEPINPDIRRCFEFCNIFPRRCKLRRDELIRLWIAQGFIKTSYATEDMEDVAEGYIEELVSCSFLQQERSTSDTDFFTIHDLVHDLLDNFAGSDYFRIENASRQRVEDLKGDVPRDVRHLFIWNYDEKMITEKILRLENLRTLIIYVVDEIYRRVDEKIINSICKRLPKLRILAVAFGYQYAAFVKQRYVLSVPESIGLLKHLRYLSFRTFHHKVILPSVLSKLHHIQLLDFGPGIDLDFPSAGLSKLRHIFCRLDVKFPNIGNLTSLQTLPSFTVRNEQGYEVKQLRDLNKLRGTLRIRGLGNVKSKEEALEANLAAKERLRDVSLGFHSDGTRCSPEVEAEVLDGICPPVRLETLEISDYEGSRYPDWMVGKHNGCPKDLQALHLDGFTLLGPGPQLEAFPRLRVLHMSYCLWGRLTRQYGTPYITQGTGDHRMREYPVASIIATVS